MANLPSIVDQIKSLSPAEQIVLIKLVESHPLRKHPGVWLVGGIAIGIVYVLLTYNIRYYCVKKNKK